MNIYYHKCTEVVNQPRGERRRSQDASAKENHPKKSIKKKETGTIAGVPRQQPDHLPAAVGGQAAGGEAGLKNSKELQLEAGVPRSQPDHIPADADGQAVRGETGHKTNLDLKSIAVFRVNLNQNIGQD